MARFFAVLLLTLFSITGAAQSFEGEIIYKNSYKSKLSNITDGQLTAMMGSRQEYYIRGGDYKSVLNGVWIQWQLYINEENKLYTKVGNSETLMWNDGAVNSDEILQAELNKGVVEILGYLCDELVLTCKSGVQKYYFSERLSVDPKLYAAHKFGNWYDYLSRSHSLSLKTIIDNAQFTIETVAIEVKEMKLEKSFFDLPPNSKSIKSPY